MTTTHKIQGVAILVLMLVLIMATAFVLPGGNDSNRADDAWSARLNGQAAQELEKARSERALATWSARLTAQAASLEDETLQAQARSEAVRLARANKAWSDRLTGQAAAEAAAK